MENNSFENGNRVQVPELRKNIDVIEKEALEHQKKIDDMLVNLKMMNESLEDSRIRLENMEDAKRLDEDHADRFDKMLENTSEYSKEDMEQIKTDIHQTKMFIDQIHKEMTDLVLKKVELGEQIEEFEKLERDYNESILKFPEEYLTHDLEDFKVSNKIDFPQISKEQQN